MTKTIMVVDDEEDIRETVKTVMEKEGYNVVTAINGDDALKKAGTVNPDLILIRKYGSNYFLLTIYLLLVLPTL